MITLASLRMAFAALLLDVASGLSGALRALLRCAVAAAIVFSALAGFVLYAELIRALQAAVAHALGAGA